MFVSDIKDQVAQHVADGEPVGRCEDVLIDLRERQVVYWRIDLGQDGSYAPVLIANSVLGVSDGTIAIDLPRATLDKARHEAEALHETPVDGVIWPDLITGPFGYTVSPSGMAAFAGALADSQNAKPNPRPKNAPDDWVWFADLRGMALFSNAGELGQVRDATITVDSGALASLIVDADGSELAVPAQSLRHLPESGDYLVANVNEQGQQELSPVWKASPT